ncbi:hypothetical protein CUC00_11795 [Prevotella intermedia]|nr:hypothetical protein CTM44_10930 [Prevotella intermedia]ATV41766.1 hypothetical protein CUC00_11795 [Prevotella intermedia]
MNCYRIYSFFIHKLSNAAKVINKGHLRGFSLPNVHYAQIKKYSISIRLQSLILLTLSLLLLRKSLQSLFRVQPN